MSLNVTLPEDLEPFIGAQVASGTFSSPDALVAACVRAFQLHPLATAEAHESLMRGYQQSEDGEYSDRSIEDICRDARARFEANGGEPH